MAITGANLNDLYFAPVLFSEPSRRAAGALPSRWLFADLDFVNPKGLELPPTLSWETSAGRWQALWLMERALPWRELEDLNRRLTYFTGADRSGWTASKVLRVPGSVSHKYARPWTVRLLPGDRPTYSARQLQRDVPPLARVATPPDLSEDLPDPDTVRAYWRGRLPVPAVRLLTTRYLLPCEDRSAHLWRLACLLLEAGVPPAQTLVLIRGSLFNKWAGQRDELGQLWRDVSKAAAHVESERDKT